jgi:predicted DNA repair protein MutK
LDDITTVLDDVATMTKVAAQKTAGVLGDDLALNSQQVAGVRAEREIPVVLAVAKGSFKNKLILVPAALAISELMPWLIIPLLMLGGAYLCLEGFEKVAHRFLHSKAQDSNQHSALSQAAAASGPELIAYEADKIKGAIRTDFVLSAEIIVIALGTVADSVFPIKAAVVSGIALIMTIGVYGFVAAIVKLDDLGIYLCRDPATTQWIKLQHAIGRVCLAGAPWLMRFLTVIGTAAMFLVGGGIVTHGIPWLHHGIEAMGSTATAGPLGDFSAFLIPILLDALAGLLTGFVSWFVVVTSAKLWRTLLKAPT